MYANFSLSNPVAVLTFKRCKLYRSIVGQIKFGSNSKHGDIILLHERKNCIRSHAYI